MFEAFLGSFTRFLLAYFNDVITQQLIAIGIAPEIAGGHAESIVSGSMAVGLVIWSYRAHLKSQNKIKALEAENAKLRPPAEPLADPITWNEPKKEPKYND